MSEFKGPGPVATDSEVGHTELPDESGEVSEQEVVENDPAAKFLSMAEQLEAVNTGKNESLMAMRIASGAEKEQLIDQYNEQLERSRQLSRDMQLMKNDMKKEGWIYSEKGDSAFQVRIDTNKDGKKLFKIADTFGETPVKKGEAFPAYVSSAHSIPEIVRGKIMDAFTFDGDGAKELYINIPETE